MVKVCYPICTHLKNITCEQMGIFRTLMAAFFFCFFFVHLWLGWYQHKEKTQKGEMLYRLWFVLDPMGLFTLYSATASVEQIKNVDIWGQFKMIFFFKWKKVCPLYACILEPQTNSYTQTSAQFRNKTFFTALWGKWKEKWSSYEDSWIDFFDPSLRKHEKETVAKQDIGEFANPYSKILDSSPSSEDLHDNEHSSGQSEKNIAHLSLLSRAEDFVNQICRSFERTFS